MEKGYIHIKTEMSIMENIKMIMQKEKGYFIIKMAIEMKENLKEVGQ